MFEFIKYCFYCLSLAVSGSFGYNPEGLTLTTGIIGVLTFFALIGLGIFLLYLIALLLKR